MRSTLFRLISRARGKSTRQWVLFGSKQQSLRHESRKIINLNFESWIETFDENIESAAYRSSLKNHVFRYSGVVIHKYLRITGSESRLMDSSNHVCVFWVEKFYTEYRVNRLKAENRFSIAAAAAAAFVFYVIMLIGTRVCG